MENQTHNSTGHIIGRIANVPQTLTPTRNLSPLAAGILRCLTHVAMLLGTEQNSQVCQYGRHDYVWSYAV